MEVTIVAVATIDKKRYILSYAQQVDLKIPPDLTSAQRYEMVEAGRRLAWNRVLREIQC